MLSLRVISTAITITLCLSCRALNYPVEDPVKDSTHGSALEDLINGEVPEPLAWSDLTRLAREHRQRGEFGQAGERLAQAAIQVGDLPPSHAQRRTVFGLRARLAIDLADSGDLETADVLADQLIAEAEAEPELGGSALVSLAVSVADRLEAAADESAEPESQLHLLRIALVTAQAGSISRDRMNLAIRVADTAYPENEVVLARTAIDQALSDALHVIPTNKGKISAIQLKHARIALASGDFAVAKKSAMAANRLVDEIDADASTRGIAEATLAEILAETGESETALVIATGANARIGIDDELTAHARRRILTALGRVESSLGDRPSAKAHFERALAIPGQDLRADIDLVRELTRALAEWETPEDSSERDSGSSLD